MNFFLDTEFYERPGRLDLISIGIVSEDEREYYAQSIEAPYAEIETNEWLKANVLSCLDGSYRVDEYGFHCIGDAWRTAADIRSEILAFVGDDPAPLFHGYFADYDWVAFCWLFGRMIDLPKGWPFFCIDLKQMMFARSGIVKEKPPIAAPVGEHNALVDARWNRELWLRLK